MSKVVEASVGSLILLPWLGGCVSTLFLHDALLSSLFHLSCFFWLPADTPVALPKGEYLQE